MVIETNLERVRGLRAKDRLEDPDVSFGRWPVRRAVARQSKEQVGGGEPSDGRQTTLKSDDTTMCPAAPRRGQGRLSQRRLGDAASFYTTQRPSISRTRDDEEEESRQEIEALKLMVPSRRARETGCLLLCAQAPRTCPLLCPGHPLCPVIPWKEISGSDSRT